MGASAAGSQSWKPNGKTGKQELGTESNALGSRLSAVTTLVLDDLEVFQVLNMKPVTKP